MFQFSWAEIITENFIEVLTSGTGIDLRSQSDVVNPLFSTIFKATGGLPDWTDILNDEQKSRLAINLFSEALTRHLSSSGVVYPLSGYFLQDSKENFDEAIVPIEKININSATATDLEVLPMIGSTLARNIITERNSNGLYISFDDLIERVEGLGEGSKKKFGNALRFTNPVSESKFKIGTTLTLSEKFLFSLSVLPGENSVSKAIQLLNILATTLMSSPHPASYEKQIRIGFEINNIEFHSVDWLSVLESSDYLRYLPQLLQQALISIKMAMFHVALPDENHPTKQLLDELIQAKNRGIEVKVLLDQDRDTDPYKSKIINTPAKAFLESNGVECRFDSSDTLLHSKFLVKTCSQQ